MKNIKILLIEDNPDDVELLREMFLEAHCSLAGFMHVDELSAALELLEKESFEIVLMDMSLPDSSGSQTFYSLRDQIPETPIVVITGTKDETIIQDLLQNGVQDYLVKGTIDPNSLMHSVNYAIERQRLLVSLKQKTLEIQALKESLEHIISNNADAMVVVNRRGVICYANPAAAEILVHEREELTGREFGFPIAPGKASELNIDRKDGSTIVGELRAVEITWKDSPAYLASIRDITEQRQIQDEIADLSFRDKLTGLYNRAFLEAEIKGMNTERNLPLCVIMGDVNNLKLVNDALGHGEGDKLLISVAQILRKACRKDDIVVRLGGDEFIILLPKCDEAAAMRITDKIRTSCEAIAADGIPVSIALGIAVQYKPGQSALELLDMADKRMYANKFAESKNRYSSVIAMLEKSLYEKDYVTGEHTARVRKLCVRFGTELQLSKNSIDELKLLSSLHDIGKIAVPEAILKKKGPLTDEEWEIIKKHPETGYRITKAIYGMDLIAEDIFSHHERWDGKGYPQGLKGEQIPLASRILSIIDTFDVMTHDRPYKSAMSKQDAMNEIKRCSGSQFDPTLATQFISYLEHGESMGGGDENLKTQGRYQYG
ncbi:HD domain-containing phosphohydrolase [Sporomusa termitida]|uniref:Regulator of RpoS n=1 Tax=Sporomusa termitida TaxID=2377 RepID=A0A517DQI9_9FIRM|nr:HD domain-containing phosphohydrolase [Sporomusa termitida]QDR79629.1 Regulator of RpoS [Sporomusa termitida]